ncbi:hypothetical protein AALO_G00199020 [Alosa alosa]|uniref:EGF-like domain-containing protein n=2 Tax=Alosa alosa TaxID=278164 RepID=A0AAV6G6Y0_9TELE|nr:hypothetical protein AALO_G00199020 [Alosa alosa]
MDELGEHSARLAEADTTGREKGRRGDCPSETRAGERSEGPCLEGRWLEEEEDMDVRLIGLGLLVLGCLGSSQKLSPRGRNVCLDHRDPSSLVCCDGWRQQGDECSIPLCEGEGACQQDEVCVYPGMCRCRPGYFGAQCKTSCPPEFWASDCREHCLCHPNGRCHPATGECTCLPNRWGPLCQHECMCGRHGHCDLLHGNCTCDEGWWTSTCGKMCHCFEQGTTTCIPSSGQCVCKQGYYGQKCSLRCNCYLSPCDQNTGHCQCVRGWWGPGCDRHCNCDLSHGECDPSNGECVCEPGYKSPVCHEPCSPGYHGRGCLTRCGHCLKGAACSAVDGSCKACDPGWNGTRCDQLCPLGFYGDHCRKACPTCKNQEACDPVTGECSHCNPGWIGPRCDNLCPVGTFGDGCRFQCSPCYYGQCNPVAGNCICQPGFQGESCNSTCPDHLYGVNCSSVCNCGEVGCHRVSGACLYSSQAGLIMGLLILVLLVLIVLLCCCCCCCSEKAPTDGKERVSVGDGGPALRMKHHVYSVLATVSSSIPCTSLWTSGLPRVTVSHHDPELTFNHSFIEPPSSGWLTDNSFESDEGEEGEALYCVPPREDISTVAGGEFQELSSKCNMFPDPSAFSSEDMSLAFGIPRTSSIAKSKRPSVSFAEGTKFSPKERRGSGQELPAVGRKPKTPWGVLMVSALQSREEGGMDRGDQEPEVGENFVDEQTTAEDPDDPEAGRYASAPSHSTLAVPGSSRRRTLSNPTKKNAQTPALTGSHQSEDGLDKVTTVYVTVGKASHGSKAETSSEGPVQAMLRRLGSIQRQREEGSKPKARGEAIVKPPRRKLGARAAVWEQVVSTGGGGSPPGAVPMRKPSRRKHTTLSSPCPVSSNESSQEGVAPKRPLSSILKSVPEWVAPASPRRDVQLAEPRACCPDPPGEDGYLTVGTAQIATNLREVIANEVIVACDDDVPKYENVMHYESNHSSTNYENIHNI